MPGHSSARLFVAGVVWSAYRSNRVLPDSAESVRPTRLWSRVVVGGHRAVQRKARIATAMRRAVVSQQSVANR